MKKILKNPYKLSILIGTIFISGMILGSFGYTRFFAKKTNSQFPISNFQTNYPLPEIIEEQRETTKDAKTFNILLTGHGGAGHPGGGLMDAIIVVNVNVTDKKANLISFPRDFWFSGHKINADPSLKDALTGVTGLPISHFISIDFSSFTRMVDSFDGITVDVKKAYTDNFYPVRGKENELCEFSAEKVADLHSRFSGFELEKQFTCRYETLQFLQGKQNMDGETTLKYVRSRHGDGDFGRSMRQFEVLKAILQKGNIEGVSKALAFVKTDLNLESVNTILEKIGNPLEYSISYIGLSDQNVLQNGKNEQGAYILQSKPGVNIKEYIRGSL